MNKKEAETVIMHQEQLDDLLDSGVVYVLRDNDWDIAGVFDNQQLARQAAEQHNFTITCYEKNKL